jgi:hypothetical protein
LRENPRFEKPWAIAVPSSWKKAGSRARTDDLLITNQLLYQLSYAGVLKDEPEASGDRAAPQPHFSFALRGISLHK